jgi:hypothetical protein
MGSSRPPTELYFHRNSVLDDAFDPEDGGAVPENRTGPGEHSGALLTGPDLAVERPRRMIRDRWLMHHS